MLLPHPLDRGNSLLHPPNERIKPLVDKLREEIQSQSAAKLPEAPHQ